MRLGVIGVVAADQRTLFHFRDGGLDRLSHLDGDEASELARAFVEQLRGAAHALGALGERALAVDAKGGVGARDRGVDFSRRERLERLQRLAGCRVLGSDRHGILDASNRFKKEST